MPKFIPAVCPGCGAGCGLYLECETNNLVLSAPSRSDAVSEGRLCMRGWQMGDMVRNSLRLGSPLLKGSPTSWENALGKTASLLQPLLDGPTSRLGIVAAGHLTNEEGFAVAQFARQVLGSPHIDNFGRSVDGPTIWGLQHQSRKVYSRPPLSELINYDVIICLSSNLGYLNAQACSWVARAQQMGAKLVVIDQIDDGLGTAADIFLQHVPAAGGVVLHQLTEALGPQGSLDDVDALSEVGSDGLVEAFGRLVETLRKSERVAVVMPTRAYSTPYPGIMAAELAAQLNSREGTSADVFAVNGTPNSVGLGHMGLVPYLAQPAGTTEGALGEGLGLFEMLDTNQQKLDGLIVVGEELMSWLDRDGMAELRDTLDVLIVLDSFRTAVSRIADVTLPISGYGEREGSFTTLDGKVRWTGQALEPYAQSRHLPEVLADLAQRLGGRPGPRTIDAIWEQISCDVPGYKAITPQQLRADNDLDVDLQAIPANYSDDVQLQEHYSPIKVADPERWQYTLLWRYDAHWWIYDGRMWSLPLLYREMRDWRAEHVLMNAEDMKREQLRPGRPIVLISAKGRAEVAPYPHENLPKGLIVVPAHQRHLMEVLMGPGRFDKNTCAMAYRCTPARIREG